MVVTVYYFEWFVVNVMFQNVNELENFPMGRNIYNYMRGIIIVERGSERGYG